MLKENRRLPDSRANYFLSAEKIEDRKASSFWEIEYTYFTFPEENESSSTYYMRPLTPFLVLIPLLIFFALQSKLRQSDRHYLNEIRGQTSKIVAHPFYGTFK